MALKVLPLDLMRSPERRERFEREARAVSRLSHPHICTLYDVGREGDTDFLVMEYLEGEPLVQRLQRGPLPLEETLSYAVQVAEALDAAHRRGVIHRDLKPANVVLTRSGAKLLDFGLAKLISPPGGVAATPDRTAAAAGLVDATTRSGLLLGTPHYMSPEQLEGRRVDARADVFAFGCLVFEMVTGERAFRGDTQASVIAAILRDAPAALGTRRGGLPEGLTRVVDRCLEKDPNARFRSMREVCEALATLSPGAGYRDSGRRRSVWRGLAIAGGVAVVLVVAPYMAMRSNSPPAALTTQEGASTPHIRSIAVLPLDNYSGDPSQDYFAEGMTDELTTQLARISRLRVTLQRDYEGARRLAQRSADLDPTYFLSVFSFGWIDIQEGKVKEAILNFEKAKAMESPAFVSAWLAYAYGASGNRDAARAELEEVKKRSLGGKATAFNLALVSLGLGDHARAVSYLEQAYATDSQWLGWLKGDRVFDPLRSDPRFVALMRKLNLEE